MPITSEDHAIRAKKREIARRYDFAKKADKKDDKRRRGWWRVRIGALNKVFGGELRYGGGKLYEFTDDDAGREDLCILLDHYAHSNPGAIPRVIKARAPWLAQSERETLLAHAGRYWKSPELAKALGLMEWERVKLGGVPTIGAVDMSPEERKATRKHRDLKRKLRKRRAAGMKRQADSISRKKPWKAECISRSTWYRRRRETTLSAVNLTEAADITVSSVCDVESNRPGSRQVAESIRNSETSRSPWMAWGESVRTAEARPAPRSPSRPAAPSRGAELEMQDVKQAA